MATLYVRDVPDALYEQLKARAEEEGRSVNAETIIILRRALDAGAVSQRRILSAIASRPRFDPQAAGAPSSTELLREDRAR
ncbi:MAG: Arc family DNA-binding protein [Chloroflexi bacterium]|nr:Arc family DNA-binding protein [Chloroflexota bacterium]